MYKHILIATDGSELATKALEHGLALVTVTEPWLSLDMAVKARKGRPDPFAEFNAIAAGEANHILEGAGRLAKAHGTNCDMIHVKDQHPAEGIIATAAEKDCDLIVMASHGRRGASRLLFGSQAYEVLARCRVPALIVR
jgi:nucleotide-binding universal stress UspA family protein